MAVSIIGGPQVERGAGYRAKETLSQSTATSFQAVALTTPITHLGGGTATGATVNLYSLASGAVEGMEKSILCTATGEAKLLFTIGTATGQWVFSQADDYLHAIYEDGTWRILRTSGPTLSTST